MPFTEIIDRNPRKPRLTWRDRILDWFIENYATNWIVTRADYETFRNRAVDWVAERERSVEEKSGRIKHLERVIVDLANENQHLRTSAMRDMGINTIDVRAKVVHDIQRFDYRMEFRVSEEAIVRLPYPIGRDWLRHIFRELSLKFATQFKEIVRKLPIPDAQKSADELHDEVFDPNVTDLQYFERRSQYHGLSK